VKRAIVSIAIALIVGVIAILPCRGDDPTYDPDLRVFEGKVVNVDTTRSVLTVKGALEIEFPISSDTALQRDIYDIELPDISTGDYVTVQYYRSGSESRVPSKVVMVTVEYRASDDSW